MCTRVTLGFVKQCIFSNLITNFVGYFLIIADYQHYILYALDDERSFFGRNKVS